MATTDFFVSYRPIRIGFLVRDSSVGDLIQAVGVNTLLAGGMFNPIIPVSENTELARNLVGRFNVDVLHGISESPEIDAFLESYPGLRRPLSNRNLFHPGTDNADLAYLDIDSLIRFTAEKRVQNNFAAVRWNETDAVKNVFAVSFGYFPTGYHLKHDFLRLFVDGLHADQLDVGLDGPVPTLLAHAVQPIRCTALHLKRYGGGGTNIDNGIYIGEEDNFDDLCCFWNLRAAGLAIEFAPMNHIPRFSDYLQTFIRDLDEERVPSLNIGKWINAYYRQEVSIADMVEAGPERRQELQEGIVRRREEIQQVLGSFTTERKQLSTSEYSDYLWASKLGGIRVARFDYGRKNALGHIDESKTGYKVTVDLPSKEISGDPEPSLLAQALAVSINHLGGFQNGEVTLKPPFIPDINSFYSAKIAIDPWKLRSGQDGISLLIRADERFLTLFPLSQQEIVRKIFEHAGITATMSPPGLKAKQIIECLGGIDAARVFKIRGVRRLFSSLRKDRPATRHWAEGVITRQDSFTAEELRNLLGPDFDRLSAEYFDFKVQRERYVWKQGANPQTISDDCVKEIFSGDFKRFEGLYIEPRETKRLTVKQVFDFLLGKDFLRAGLQLCCAYCNEVSWLSLRDLDDFWFCQYCGSKNRTSLQLSNQDWKFRKSGFFSTDDHQKGAVPVILTLLQFHRTFYLSFSSLLRTSSLKLKVPDCEIDLCVVRYGTGTSIEIGIGECKSRGEIDQKDIDNFTAVREKFKEVDIDCIPVFAKTTDGFTENEILRFKNMASNKVPCILLSNSELEPYEPYDNYTYEALPNKKPFTLGDMVENSKRIYLEAHTAEAPGRVQQTSDTTPKNGTTFSNPS